MMQLELIKKFFPAEIRENTSFQKYMLKEYIQLLILDFLSTTPFIKKIVLIVVTKTLKTVDLNKKKRDFEHLLFNKRNSERILSVGEFIQDLK